MGVAQRVTNDDEGGWGGGSHYLSKLMTSFMKSSLTKLLNWWRCVSRRRGKHSDKGANTRDYTSENSRENIFHFDTKYFDFVSFDSSSLRYGGL